jgi:hypothetical protein
VKDCPTERRSLDPCKVEAALRRAAVKAYELGKKTHTPVFILRDGRLIDLTKEDEAADE